MGLGTAPRWLHVLMGCRALFVTFAPIAIALLMFAHYPGAVTFVVAFVVIGIRQHAMLLLGHETWHGTLFPSGATNRLVGRWLCFHPLLCRYDALRDAHLLHHARVGHEDDPYTYFWRYDPGERGTFAIKLLSLVSGMTFLRALAGAAGIVSTTHTGVEAAGRRRSPAPHAPVRDSGGRGELAAILAVQIVLLASFTASIGWIWYFLLWVAPAVTIALLIDFIRNWAEHRAGGLWVFHSNPVERLVFAPLNFRFHAVHHLYPGVPWFRIPAVARRVLPTRDNVRVQRGYIGALGGYLRGTATTETNTLAPSGPKR